MTKWPEPEPISTFLEVLLSKLAPAAAPITTSSESTLNAWEPDINSEPVITASPTNGNGSLAGRFVSPPPSPLKYPAEAVCGNKTFPVSNEPEIAIVVCLPINNSLSFPEDVETSYPILILLSPASISWPAV